MIPRVDLHLGLGIYGIPSPPLTGRIRKYLEDFQVWERVNGRFLSHLRRERSPSHGYPVFYAVKRDIDTVHFRSSLAKHLGIPHSSIHTLGLKDAQAVSTQILALDREPLQSLEWERGSLRLLGWSRRLPIKADLLGNSFKVIVRDIRESPSSMERAVEEFCKGLAERGIPNFYGYQRFGGPRFITHLVGERLVKGDPEGAVWLYLTKSSIYEDEEVRGWRLELEAAKDLKRAYNQVPRRLTYERMILRSLLRKRGDYIRALRALPVMLRRLFINAYQSYLYNKLLTRRVEEGLPIKEPIPGDWVTGRDHIRIYGRSVEEGRVSLLLPLFGLGYTPSQGLQGELEEEILEEEDVTPRSFYIKEIPEMTCRSVFRKALLTPRGFTILLDKEVGEATCTFTLDKGSYATILLRELIKPSDPILQGF